MNPDEELRIVARNIARFRAELGDGVTQQNVADMAGLSVFSVSRYEGGQGMPSREALRKLAHAFGRQMEDFFNPQPPPPDPSRRQPFAVRFKIVGTPPPGFEKELQRVLKKYTPEEAARQAEIKKKYRGKDLDLPPRPLSEAPKYKPKKMPDHPPPISTIKKPKK